ncbi:MAG: hypothetical protein ACRDJE_20500 [Dehalococcoidia bacterium]
MADVEAETPAAPSPPAAPVRRATATRQATATSQGARGIVTDYGYVVGELRRIFVLTVGITALLLVLWLIIG